MIDPTPLRPAPTQSGPPFGKLLRSLRVRAGLSQNQLARTAGVDPAYVNRLERAPDDSTAMPSRKVTLSLWEALEVGPSDRERLLVAAGHVPQAIVVAGGWDAYVENMRRTLTDDVDAIVSKALRYLVAGQFDPNEGAKR